MSRVKDISKPYIWFQRFIGSSKISRILGNIGDGSGYAIFEKHDDDTLIYREKLHLTIGDKSTIGYKIYKYKITDEMDYQEIFKYFSDDSGGGIFYKLDINDDSDTAIGYHLCSSDHYNAFYKIFSNDNFEIKYSVNGPSKDYEIITNYCRISGDIDIDLHL